MSGKSIDWKSAVSGSPKHRLAFRKALHEANAGVLRWGTIVAVARQLGMDVRVAILLAADGAAAGLVRLDIKGPPYRLLPSSAKLTDEGWKSVTKRAAKSKIACTIDRPQSRQRACQSRSKQC